MLNTLVGAVKDALEAVRRTTGKLPTPPLPSLPSLPGRTHTPSQVRIIETADTDELWSHIGPVLNKHEVCDETGLDGQAVEHARLLKLTAKNGKTRWPAFTFEHGRVADGIEEVMNTWHQAAGQDPQGAEAWALASWLIGPNLNFDWKSPVEILRHGSHEQRLEVLEHVSQRAKAAAGDS